jgi:hypothetical protein
LIIHTQVLVERQHDNTPNNKSGLGFVVDPLQIWDYVTELCCPADQKEGYLWTLYLDIAVEFSVDHSLPCMMTINTKFSLFQDKLFEALLEFDHSTWLQHPTRLICWQL